jgi:tRNA A-37 threonylcarbamoyl transferase component Bud32
LAVGQSAQAIYNLDTLTRGNRMLVIPDQAWREGLLISHGASWMQANVYLTHQGDQKIVVKDFGGAPFLVRYLLCRFIIKRETRALQLLDGAGITPRYLGPLNDYAYAMQYIEGENFRFKIHIKNIADVLALEEAVKRMHQLGVAHNDLHTKNIIVDRVGHFYFIDFASCFFKSNQNGLWADFKNKLFSFFVSVDRSKIAYLKRKYDPLSLTPEDQKFLSVKTVISACTKAWKKLINNPLLRKRTWQKRKAWLTSWWKF